MGSITRPPTFLPTQPPIPFSAANVGEVLTVLSATTLGFAAGSGGGGLPARYVVALSGGTIDLNPGSGWPNSDTGARLIVNPSASTGINTLVAGNDGEMVLLWNNAALGSGFYVTLNNLTAGAYAEFTLSGTALVIPPQGRSLLVYDATLGLWSAG